MAPMLKHIQVRVKTQRLISRKNTFLDCYEAKKNALAVWTIRGLNQGNL